MALLALFELIGVASVFPFMALLATPEQIVDNDWLARAYELGGFSSHRSFIITAGIMVMVLLVLSRALAWGISYWRDRLEWGIYLRTSERLLRFYLNRPYRYFLNQNTADLRGYLINETMNLVQGVLAPLITIMINGATALVIVLLVLIVNPVVAFSTALILGGAYALIFLLRKGPMHRLGEERLQTGLRRNRSLEELFTGIKTVKTYGNEAIFLERYRQDTRQLATINPRLRVMYQMPRFLLEVLAFCGIILVTLLLFIRQGDLTSILPTLTLFTVAGYRLLPALQQVFGAVSTRQTFRPTLDRLKPDLLAALEQETIPTPDPQPAAFTQEITLQDLTFSFPETETPLFKELQLTINYGDTVAFVGSTGSGKTTLADLITGLLQPTAGAVLIDGNELSPHLLSAWRSQLAYVPQHIYLYDASLRENIVFGCPGSPTDETILEVLHQVQLGDFVRESCPAGLDTPLGENGVRLSGGQRQRIGLARALLRRPTLLVLDEATSALDTTTEKAIRSTLRQLDKYVTTLIIAHRLSTVEDADVIHVVEKGKIIASGDYATLIASNLRFQELSDHTPG